MSRQIYGRYQLCHIVLRYCNSLANPLIYSGINRQFRAGIKRCLFRRDEYIEEMQTTAATQRTQKRNQKN